MSTTFNRTRTELATLVLGKLGVLPSTKAPITSAISADADLVYEAIDLRLKEMHRLGIFWRKVTNVPVTFSLSSSVATASAGAGDILFPLKVTFTNGTNDDPVDLIGYKQYAEIEDKTRTGNPEKAMWKGGSEFIFYPIPTANGTAKLLYEKIADDTSAGGVIDVEVSMLRWVRDMVCYDIGDHYGNSDQKMLRWQRESEIAERNIRKLAVERVDFSPVAVDDWTGVGRTETDYRR